VLFNPDEAKYTKIVVRPHSPHVTTQKNLIKETTGTHFRGNFSVNNYNGEENNEMVRRAPIHVRRPS